MAKIDYAAVRNTLNMPNLTDTAVREAMRGAGVSTNEQAQAWARQNAAPTQGSFASRGFGALEQAFKPGGHPFAKDQPLGEIAGWLGQGMSKAPAPAKGKAKAKAAAPAGPSAADQQKQMEAAIANSPWQHMMNAVEKTYASELAPVVSAMSGADTVPIQNQAMNQAMQLVGGGPGDAAFLKGAQTTANAVNAPVQAAWGQEAAQYQANQGPISNALAAYANANELMTATAGGSAWLNAALSHVTTNLSYQGAIPKADIGSIPPGVLQAMKQAGGYPGVSNAGLVSLSQLAPNQSGGVSVAPGAGNTGVPGVSGGFTIPTAGGSSAPGQ